MNFIKKENKSLIAIVENAVNQMEGDLKEMENPIDNEMENAVNNILSLTRKITQEIFSMKGFKPERKEMVCKLIDFEDFIINFKNPDKQSGILIRGKHYYGE